MRFRAREAESPSIELTPLIDVVFLLLIFLMISTTFVSRTGLQIQVPEADSAAANPDSARVEVMVTEKGDYLVDGEELAGEKALAAVLRRRSEQVENTEHPLLVIRADRNARHGAVVAAMDAGSAAGLGRVAISTVRPEAGEAP
ncbi:ExbD/TolR family protein [Thiohalorhabdus sp. Cl-TMA]|uniref:ExbD/TolR family protein n=1 Tax=Thiohalorhabdus methylotrophus TaxID=3242694 RepID=A0ABV4TW33_9GAMM